MLNKKISSVFFTALDFETTGLNPNKDKIIEIGAIKFNTMGEEYRFSGLINPKTKIPAIASSVNGIYDEMVFDKPAIEEILPGFLDFISGTSLIAHNIGFDASFLSQALHTCGLKTEDFLCLDTMAFAKKCFPGFPSYSLGNICKQLNINIENAHRAEDDAEACMKIFLKCLKKIPNYNQLNIKDLLKNAGIAEKRLYKNYYARK